LWGDYTFKTGPLTGFGFGAGVRYNGISYADTANTLLFRNTSSSDAAIHYEMKNWRLALNINHIGDKIYVGSCSTPSACFYGDRGAPSASVSSSVVLRVDVKRTERSRGESEIGSDLVDQFIDGQALSRRSSY